MSDEKKSPKWKVAHDMKEKVTSRPVEAYADMDMSATMSGTTASYAPPAEYELNYEQITTKQDIMAVFKAMGFVLQLNPGQPVPDNCHDAWERGLFTLR